VRFYDTETSREIDNLRLKQRMGPKPNANSHIVIFPAKMDYSQWGFKIKEKKWK
jgi:hypothetical protein